MKLPHHQYSQQTFTNTSASCVSVCSMNTIQIKHLFIQVAKLYLIFSISYSIVQHTEAYIRMSYSRSIAANSRLWPNIAPKIRYQARGFRRHMEVSLKSVISFHCRNMCAFSAVGGVFMCQTVWPTCLQEQREECVHLMGAKVCLIQQLKGID